MNRPSGQILNGLQQYNFRMPNGDFAEVLHVAIDDYVLSRNVALNIHKSQFSKVSLGETSNTYRLCRVQSYTSPIPRIYKQTRQGSAQSHTEKVRPSWALRCLSRWGS